MSSGTDTSMAWLPVEVARVILSRLSPIENCMLSQVCIAFDKTILGILDSNETDARIEWHLRE